MNNNDFNSRFQQALSASKPFDALRKLAASLKSEGMLQQDMYDLFEHHRALHFSVKDDLLHVAITDTMDFITGYCAPVHRLFDQPLPQSMEHVCSTFVKPFYMSVLHGNYAGLLLAKEDSDERQAFIRSVKAALDIVDHFVVSRLFEDNNWRLRIVAAWFCGLKGWRQYSDLIGNLLVPSTHCYAGQAYCFALACFGDEKSARHLCRYLNEYLPHPELHYDQHWAMPALMWIDTVWRTNYSLSYLQVGGLWDQFDPRTKGGMEHLAEHQQRFERLMWATTKYFGIG